MGDHLPGRPAAAGGRGLEAGGIGAGEHPLELRLLSLQARESAQQHRRGGLRAQETPGGVAAGPRSALLATGALVVAERTREGTPASTTAGRILRRSR